MSSNQLIAKKNKSIKGALLAKLADIEINGKCKKGLMNKALKKIEQWIDSGNFEKESIGIDRLLKLLPYALPKIGYDKPLIAGGDSITGSNSFQQVNIYLQDRLQSLDTLKEISGVSRETSQTPLEAHETQQTELPKDITKSKDSKDSSVTPDNS